jgi:hypothetical protein
MGFLASAADERVLGVEFTDDALSVSLRDGRIISVPLVWYPRLLSATAAQRKNWKIAGGGYGLHWPDIDEDLSTEGLLRGAPAAKALPAVVDGRKVQERDHPRIIPIAELEKQTILDAISELNGDRLAAARLLGIGKAELYRKLKEYGAQVKR